MNENMRLMLALALTIVVLVVWNILFPPPNKTTIQQNQTAKQQNEVKEKEADYKSEQSVFQNQEQGSFLISKGELITINTPLYRAVVNSQGGILEELELKKYKQSIRPDSKNVKLIDPVVQSKGPLGILWNYNPTWKVVKWEYSGTSKNLSKDDSQTLTFKASLGGVLFIKKLTFFGNTYKVDEDLEVVNTSDHPMSGILGFCIATTSNSNHATRFNKMEVVYYSEKKGLKKLGDKKKLKPGVEFKEPVLWAGIEDNYFLISLVPLKGNFTLKGKLEENVYRVAVESRVNLSPHKGRSFKNLYFLGPKKIEYLKNLPHNLKAAINYGWLDFLAKPLVTALNFFYKYAGNYGIAIILLTVVIKILFWPLSHKSYKSMEQMKKIQPLMQQLKEKYKDDKQKLNEEMIRLYKTYKINPAGGCVPMLLQIPVFIALYEALLGAIELRHAPFIYHLPFTNIIWLADLSAKDPLYITPILMGITMFIQQKMSPTSGDPMQAKMMLLMPVFLTFLFLNFPAGLVVYFITNNILSIIQQWWMLKNK